MSLATMSFKFYTDSGLTSAFSGAKQYAHNTSLSDNPQDLQLWYGSADTAGAYIVKATSNPGVDQIVLTPTSTIVAWAAAQTFAVGVQREPTTANTYYYQVTAITTGITAGIEPTWPIIIGNTVVDGGVTWTCKAKKHPTTEIKLALTSGGLAAAAAGASLNLGTSVTSGSAHAVTFWVRMTNTVATTSDDTGYPQLDIYINNVTETAV